MAYTTIDKPDLYFNTVTYTASGSGQSVTGVNFQPDLVWLKIRNTTGSHYLNDSVRGVQKSIYSNATDAETSDNYLTSFDSDGFSLGSGNYTSPNTIVSWNWLASNSTASNTDGSITSTVSANTTSGFSIVKYTGNGTSGATVGHGLGVSPDFIIVKKTSTAEDWIVQNSVSGWDKRLLLNYTSAEASHTDFIYAVTDTTFQMYTNGSVNGSGGEYIAYCFNSVKGFSKIGSYTGNGSADGTFIYTGFKPAFILIKKTSGVASWYINDNKRSSSGGYNVSDEYLRPNLPNGTGTDQNGGDFLSNGFKLRNLDTDYNASGASYIYMCFAENPLVSTAGVPCTAR